MGFRNPLTTAAGLNTGGKAQRVVTTSTGGREGGGAVLLYPALPANAAPGALEAASGATGPLVALSSPPNLAGQRSQVLVTGADDGTEGIFLGSTAGMTLQPAPGKAVVIDGALVHPSVADTGDFALPMINGWVADTPGARYRIKHGVVHYTVTAKRNTWPQQSPVGQFPVGARPSGFTVASGFVYGSIPTNVTITADGVLSVDTGSNANSGFLVTGQFPIT